MGATVSVPKKLAKRRHKLSVDKNGQMLVRFRAMTNDPETLKGWEPRAGLLGKDRRRPTRAGALDGERGPDRAQRGHTFARERGNVLLWR